MIYAICISSAANHPAIAGAQGADHA